MASRLSDHDIESIISHHGKQAQRGASMPDRAEYYDVFIAGSGPIASTYARLILDNHPQATVYMAEIGAQDSKIPGAHHKNAIKYQKDIDAFVNVIKGALQPVSVSPVDTHIPTLGGQGWKPRVNETLIMQGNNPNQDEELNLRAAAVTRTVGGMATHWTCACPTPHSEERVNNPIPEAELNDLLEKSKKLLNVHPDQYDKSIRHQVVKQILLDNLPGDRKVGNLPLGVQRRTDNPDYVTWSSSSTILGEAYHKNPRFTLAPETRATKLCMYPGTNKVALAKVRKLENNADVAIFAKVFIVACGSIGTPQVLANSGIRPEPLGRYLVEQSLSFCQIVLKSSDVEAIAQNPAWAQQVAEHQKKHPQDPLPIPFNDPEPQVIIPYTSGKPWHCQVHRDAFSYGDVGPKSDPRVVVDIRFFGKQEIRKENRVFFGRPEPQGREWEAGITDIYGMPQATFEVTKSDADNKRDQDMMSDMCAVAGVLGSYLPGSTPQFMEPGLALHITGTTRIGTDPATSVADPCSKVHESENLWVGGNGCIPDSTACNPTLTSVAIAIKGSHAVVDYLNELKV